MLILNCGPAGLGRKTRVGEEFHGPLREFDESTRPRLDFRVET